MGNRYFHYYVEGEDDKKVINTLKTDFQLIEPGKVDKFNVVQKELNMNHMRVLKKGTIVVLVFDTDTKSSDILKKNIKFLQKQSFVSKVVCVPQVFNLEYELVRSCSIRKICELTKSKTESEFKSDVLSMNNLKERLKECGFSFDKFWTSKPHGPFLEFPNDSNQIKIR